MQKLPSGQKNTQESCTVPGIALRESMKVEASISKVFTQVVDYIHPDGLQNLLLIG